MLLQEKTGKMSETKEHILIVEDELHTRNSLSLILQGGGYLVTLAQNGSQALEKLVNADKNAPPVDLVLTDIQMPEMKGDRFLEIMKEKGISLPVIAMTGYGNTDIIDKLMHNGCKGYLEKPFDDEQLFARIRKVLDEKKANNESTKDIKQKHLERTSRLSYELETYKKTLSKLQEQIDSAADVYQDLVKLDHEGYGIEVAWKNRPLAKLGGDFVNIGKTANVYDIFLADVSGHDLGSSFHTILLKAFFEENCRKRNNGQTLFQLLNRHLLETGTNERMITAIFVRIDLDEMTGEVVSAAHPPLIQTNGKSKNIKILSIEGDALGIYKNVEFNILKFDLEPGDRLYLYTDGVTGLSRFDERTCDNEKLNLSGLSDLIQNYGNERLEDAVAHIWKDLLDFAEYKPKDDMLLFAAQIPLSHEE